MPRPDRQAFLLWLDAPFGARRLRLACAGSLDAPAQGTALGLLEESARACFDGTVEVRQIPPPNDPTPTKRPAPEPHTTPRAGAFLALGVLCPGTHGGFPTHSPWVEAARWTERFVATHPRLAVAIGPWVELPCHADAPLLAEVRDVYGRLPNIARDPTRIPSKA